MGHSKQKPSKISALDTENQQLDSAGHPAFEFRLGYHVKIHAGNWRQHRPHYIYFCVGCRLCVAGNVPYALYNGVSRKSFFSASILR